MEQSSRKSASAGTRGPEAQSPVSTRDALFRAATYFRTADFFLHNNWDDPRIQSFWNKNIEAFTEAISLLPTPGLRKVLATPYGFEVPIYWFPASDNARVERPTLMVHIGFDAGAEETYHTHGLAALERGYNVSSFQWRNKSPAQFICHKLARVLKVLSHDYVLSGKDG